MAEIDDLLDRQIAKNEKLILDAIKKLENRIVELTAMIEVKSDGTIVGPSRSLAQSRAVMKELTQSFDEIYGTAVSQTIKNYDALDVFIQNEYGIVYQGVTVNTLTSMTAIQTSIHESLAGSTLDRMNNAFIDHIINGKSKDQLIENLKWILSKRKDKAGRPFASHASTLAQDGLMEYYQTANFQTAKSIGVKKFKYQGTLIATSRDWCKDHLRKEYTIEEINNFDDDKWKGKKPGSTMINRGGYWCRHHWQAVIE